jgi:hypothetical protein
MIKKQCALQFMKEHRGFKSRDGMDEAMMGLLFNIMAFADKYYKDKL